MERENLDWFIKLLERETFDNIPAYSLLYDFNACFPKLKAEILKGKLNLIDNANVYLDLVKAEILAIWDNQQPNINHIKKWLDKYNLNIDDILKLDIKNKEFLLLFQNEHKYFDSHSKERDLSSMIHMDFFIYFKNYFVQQLFKFIDENYNIKKNETKQIQPEVTKPFKDEYLKVFCEEISNERQVKETCFDLLYESIIHYVPYLETEIKENILLLDANKKDDYLEYAIDVISKTPFAKKDSCNIDKWLKKFNVDLKEFPKFSNQELNEWLGKYYNSRIPYDYKEREFILDIQIDFYCYASMVEANKIIDFLESKKNNSSIKQMDTNKEIIKNIKWIGKPSQLGFIIGKLAELGYIEAPIKPNGDTNYNQFAKLVKNTFDIDTTEGTLSKYLNLDSEKGQETVRKFDENSFNIPHIKEVS